jgi:signal transduction histidine kinase
MGQTTADAVPIPLERELEERLSWLIRLRWFAGIGLVAGSMVGLPLLEFPVPYPLLAVVGVAVLGYNQILYLFGDRVAETLGSRQRAVHVQIAMDWLALAATIALTGGLRSPATVGFVFHLIIGAILLSRRTCYLLAVTAALLTAALGLATSPDVLQPLDPALGVAGARTTVLELWVALSFLFGVTTYLATSITARLREKEAALSTSERSLDRAYHGMEALYALGQLVNSTLDVEEVLDLIARHAATLLRGKAASIRLLDRRGKALIIGGSYGLSRAYVEKGAVDVEHSLVDGEALKGQIIEIGDVTVDERFQYPEEARREGLRSMLCCPMYAKHRALGVIRVYTGEVRSFGEDDQNLLMNLANLGAVAIENARSYSELRALDDERVWFARTTHHQLRAPLAAVQAALDALAFAGPVTDAQQNLLGRARRRIQDAFDLIRDLLDLAAAQRIEGREMPEAVRLDFALERSLGTVRERSQDKGLAFDVDLDVADWRVQAEPADLERIFSNLLENAVKYTAKGRVAFRASGAGNWVTAVVEDTGMGIEAADLERVYESFFRAASAKASGEVGTGLGLSIVKQLVSKLGGTIALQSTPGEGTTVTVRLPATSATGDPQPASVGAGAAAS